MIYVDSFLFFGGDLEFSLAEYDRFVHAHTTNEYIYGFWACAFEDPTRLHDILTAEVFKFEGGDMFELLQKYWPTYADPYIRASLFFLLNRCSSTGMPSSGKLDMTHFNPLVVSQLRRFRAPSNFHLSLHKDQELLNTIDAATNNDYLLIHPGAYKLNLFEHGQAKAFEHTRVHHRKLFRALEARNDQKWVVVYNYNPRVIALYSDYNIHMVNKYGASTKDIQAAEELIIANF